MTSEVDIAFWLINNVKEDPDGSIFFTELLNKLKDEHTMVSHRNLGERIMTEFPHVKKGRQLNKLNNIKKNIYKGISFITTPEQFISFKLNELPQHLPPSVMLISQTNEFVKVGMSSDVIRNKSIMLKVITFTQTSWKLSVTDRDINLSNLKLSNLFECNTKFLTTILKLVKDLNLCRGESHYIEENLSNLARKDVVSKVGNENYHENIVRSKYCKEIVKLSSVTGKCRRCITDIYFTELKEDTDENIPLNQADSKDISIILEKVFPNASEEMQLLLKSQHDALTTKCRKGMRWSKKVISLCLSMWVRSPQTYKDLSESQALILPSGRQLTRYKNKIPQITGLQDEVFEWMYNAAVEAKLPSNGWAGGLIHDETKIQQDLVLETRGGTPQLVGWVDTGPEGNDLRVLREGKLKQQLATEVIQIAFLGYTGFRFPVCHFPTCGIKAAELHIILSEVIAKLQDWEFQVDYIMQDGGEENRHFINSHFPGNPVDAKYLSVNMVNPDKVIAHCQDFSHNIKKVRNGIMKSGDVKGVHTRKLFYNGRHILWAHWRAAIEWDREVNSRPINQKLTDTHLFPNKAEKMRNHLAEEMMDENTLNLMKCYQASLVDGSHLNSTIALLEQTSKLIKLFRDRRPIMSTEDERLLSVEQILVWFRLWRQTVLDDKTIPVAEKGKMILSRECCDDMESLLITFPEICRNHLSQFPQGMIVPARFNSDLIENHFCQTRGLHNGNTTHPTYSAYCSTVNSVILGQTLKSRGRKSNTGICSAKPFNFYVKEPLTKKPKTSIRM